MAETPTGGEVMTAPAQIVPRQPASFRGRPLLSLMAVVGLACLPGIFLLQGRTCGVEQFPAMLSPAIFMGLAIAGLLGIVNGLVISFRQPDNRLVMRDHGRGRFDCSIY
jgi:hypothetical protein